MTSSNALQLVNEHGWRIGFANMLRKENGQWWGRNRQWLVHGMVWLLILNGLLAVNIWLVPIIQDSDLFKDRMASHPELLAVLSEEMDPPVEIFMTYMGIMPIIGAIIIAQSAIVGEKQSGTAAWIFSNPVSRPAFILAKLIATAIGVFVTAVMLPSLVAYGQIGVSEGWLPIVPYLGAMSLHSLHMLFYLSLTLMAGAFASQMGPVVAFPFGFFAGQRIARELLELFLPEFLQLLPYQLPGQATQLVTGEPIASPGAIITTALCSILFIVVAIWRFQREEL